MVYYIKIDKGTDRLDLRGLNVEKKWRHLLTSLKFQHVNAVYYILVNVCKTRVLKYESLKLPSCVRLSHCWIFCLFSSQIIFIFKNVFLFMFMFWWMASNVDQNNRALEAVDLNPPKWKNCKDLPYSFFTPTWHGDHVGWQYNTIDQFRYIKIQSETKGIISTLWGINVRICTSLFPRAIRCHPPKHKYKDLYDFIPQSLETMPFVSDWILIYRTWSIYVRRICMIMMFSSQRRDRLLFLPSNMATMTSHTNQQYLGLPLEKLTWTIIFCLY